MSEVARNKNTILSLYQNKTEQETGFLRCTLVGLFSSLSYILYLIKSLPRVWM